MEEKEEAPGLPEERNKADDEVEIAPLVDESLLFRTFMTGLHRVIWQRTTTTISTTWISNVS